MSETRQRPLILIADDNREMRNLLAEELSDSPWDLITASDGEQALLAAIEQVPDLVLLDVMMPRLSGWEVCREIRKREELSHVGVIILTAIGETLNELTSPLYGADAQMDKPFDPDVLKETITEVLLERGAKG